MLSALANVNDQPTPSRAMSCADRTLPMTTPIVVATNRPASASSGRPNVTRMDGQATLSRLAIVPKAT